MWTSGEARAEHLLEEPERVPEVRRAAGREALRLAAEVEPATVIPFALLLISQRRVGGGEALEFLGVAAVVGVRLRGPLSITQPVRLLHGIIELHAVVRILPARRLLVHHLGKG